MEVINITPKKKLNIGKKAIDHPFCFAIAANLLLLLLLLLIFRPIFETNDDIGLMNLVNGAKKVYDPHMVYSNYVWGLILSVCYRICQWMPWYTLGEYALLFLAFTAIVYVIVCRAGNISSLWIGILTISVFGYEGYVKFQYTKTAGIVSAAGFFLLFYALEEEKIRWKELVCGYGLAAFGFMIRSDQFLAEAAVISGICVMLLLQLFFSESAVRKRLFCHDIVAAAVLFLFIGGLYMIDQRAYASQEWQEYKEYNEARTELFDYGFPGYSSNKEVYESLGIDQVAYRMIKGWNHMDSELFTVETMKQLIALKKPKQINQDFFQRFFERFPFRFTTIPSFWSFLILFFCTLCWGKHTKKEVPALIYEIFVIMAVYFLLFYRGRYLYNRVDVGLWLAASLVVLWTMTGENEWFSSRSGILLVAAVLCVSQNTGRRNWKANTEDKYSEMQEKKALLEEIHSDQEHLYLFKVGTISLTKAYGVFDSIPYGIGENMYPLGGWSAKTPVYSAALDQYQVKNPFRDLINSEKVYIIDNKIDDTVEYIQKHYDENAQAIMVSEIGSYKVYSIQSK